MQLGNEWKRIKESGPENLKGKEGNLPHAMNACIMAEYRIFCSIHSLLHPREFTLCAIEQVTGPQSPLAHAQCSAASPSAGAP